MSGKGRGRRAGKVSARDRCELPYHTSPPVMCESGQASPPVMSESGPAEPPPFESSQQADPLVEIFTKNLPAVAPATASLFASGMRAYYAAYRERRDSAMNHEACMEYRKTYSTLVPLQQDDYWAFTLHFKKILVLSISHVFKTKITMLSPPTDLDVKNSTMFVDEHANRWIVQLVPPAGPPNLFPTAVNILFPRSGTKTYKHETISVRKLNVIGFEHEEGAAGWSVGVHDISKWHDDSAATLDILMGPSGQ